MTIVSYAQNHEDVLLDRAFPRGRPGFYVDIGASDPEADSVTRHFYDLGWHGINVEPSTHFFRRFEQERPRDINLNMAISDTAGELTFFQFDAAHSTASTFSAAEAARHHEGGLTSVERAVATMTLAELFERHTEPGRTIDFLSVDVEGHELQVISGGDWRTWRPRIVVVEATEPATVATAVDTPRLLVPSHAKWEPILLEADYLYAAFDGINRFYVRSEDADLAATLAVPVNILDGYAPIGQFKLQRELDTVNAQQATSWVANQTLRAEYRALATELSELRARYEKLERALTSARANAESIREEVAATLNVVGEAREAIDDIGVAGLGVARRLTAASNRYPRTAKSVKKALRVGLDLKRSVSKGASG